MNESELSREELAKLERKYDSESAFRPMGRVMTTVVTVLLAAMSIYHFYVSGFPQAAWYRFDGVNILDIALAILAVAAALYLPLLDPAEAARRAGNPSITDTFMGSVVLLFALEAARRSVGPTLPLIAGLFILYAIFGQYAPGLLKHGGVAWAGFVDGMLFVHPLSWDRSPVLL